jgi:protein-S-isoprenylcysteine O-methyltransferase Ste14
MIIFLFSIFSYLVGMSSLIYFFWLVQFPQPESFPFSWNILLLNIAIFLIFPLQHSILPRRFIKDRMNPYLHRPFYVLTSGIALWCVLLFWKPFGTIIYSNVATILLNIIFYISLALIIASTIALGHFQMFGLYQGYAAWRKMPLPSGQLEVDGIYGIVRHPITSLLLVALWSHSTLTQDRLLFNVLFSAYSLLGTVFEERSLIKEFGKDYLEYRRNVPGFFPRLSTHRRRSG